MILDAQYTDAGRAPAERFVAEEYILDLLNSWEGYRSDRHTCRQQGSGLCIWYWGCAPRSVSTASCACIGELVRHQFIIQLPVQRNQR